MKIETGNPTLEGRYVVYVQGVLEWLTPVLVTWTKGKWHYYHSSQVYRDQVKYWVGPLPVLKSDPLADLSPEYDL